MALLLLMGSALGQNQIDLSIQYHSDGGKTVIDNDGKEQVTLKYNGDGLCIFNEVQIIGSKRVLRDEFIYDHKHRITETFDYSHSSGHSKTVTTFDEQGLMSSYTKYESADMHVKANWKIVTQRTYAYDNSNRVIRFESKMIPCRWQHEHYHKIDEITHNADGTRSTLEKELDPSGRVVKQGTSRSMGRGPSVPDAPNIVSQMTQTSNGFMALTQTPMYKYETFYENNRIVQEKFYKATYGYNSIETSKYELRYSFDFKYDNGKLVEQIGKDKEELRSKRLVEYEAEKPVRFKRFYKKDGGSMNMMVKQGFTPAHEQYFPQLTGDYRPGDNLSAFGDGTDEPLNQVQTEPQYDAYEAPSYSSSGNSYGIVQDLDNTPKPPLSGESVVLDKETQALLDQIRMLANSNSKENITEAQILHLALQQLVDQHREELKELNQKYLESQQSMFD
jgi:hypothetical protein